MDDATATALLTRNVNAVTQALQSQATDLTVLKGEIVELRQSVNQLTLLLNQVHQRQLHGLAANVGTGATA